MEKASQDNLKGASDDPSKKTPPKIEYNTVNRDQRFELAPKDEEGFIQSFSIEQVEEFPKFYEKYGFVVIREVLSKEDISATIEEIIILENDNIRREDISTYTDANWPEIKRMGILGAMGPVIGPMSFKNRQNENIYKAFAAILGNKELLVTFDRYGVMRPTEDHPEWKTLVDWLHWDMNPWTYESAVFGFSEFKGRKGEYGERRVQGLVALTDTREEDGGFHTVPCFHKYFFEWAEQNREFHNPHMGDFVTWKIWKHAQRIPMRAGSLLIWDRKQVHGNYPNNSDRFRMYITMLIPGDQFTSSYPADAVLPKDFKPSELGEKLFGMKSWTETKQKDNSGSCNTM